MLLSRLDRQKLAQPGRGRKLTAIAGLAAAFVSLAALAAVAQQRPADDDMDDDPPPGFKGDGARADQGAGEEVDVGTFYEPLEKFGRWYRHPRYGNVWYPDVDPEWRPYTRGHWANTEEYGWYWVAEEEWGWAPFHYGRWAHDDRDGWFWVPGRTWAPAWVAWRHGDEHVGWAPLPPDAVWDGSGSIDYVGGSPSYAYAGGAAGAALAWIFIRPAYMTQPGLWRHVEPRHRHNDLFRGTRFQSGGYALINRRIYNRGIDFRLIERQTQRPVPRVQLQAVASPAGHGWRHMQSPNVVPVYRPRVVPSAARPPLPQILPRPVPAGGPGGPGLQPRPGVGQRPFNGQRPNPQQFPRPQPAVQPQVLPQVLPPVVRPQPQAPTQPQVQPRPQQQPQPQVQQQPRPQPQVQQQPRPQPQVQPPPPRPQPQVQPQPRPQPQAVQPPAPRPQPQAQPQPGGRPPVAPKAQRPPGPGDPQQPPPR